MPQPDPTPANQLEQIQFLLEGMTLGMSEGDIFISGEIDDIEELFELLANL